MSIADSSRIQRRNHTLAFGKEFNLLSVDQIQTGTGKIGVISAAAQPLETLGQDIRIEALTLKIRSTSELIKVNTHLVPNFQFMVPSSGDLKLLQLNAMTEDLMIENKSVTLCCKSPIRFSWDLSIGIVNGEPAHLSTNFDKDGLLGYIAVNQLRVRCRVILAGQVRTDTGHIKVDVGEIRVLSILDCSGKQVSLDDNIIRLISDLRDVVFIDYDVSFVREPIEVPRVQLSSSEVRELALRVAEKIKHSSIKDQHAFFGHLATELSKS